jgi:hypothetical protein
MRTILAIAVLLALASPCLASAESPRPRYTTLIVEYVGETDRLAPPVVITTLEEEGKWYRQHVLPEPDHFLVHVEWCPNRFLMRSRNCPD